MLKLSAVFSLVGLITVTLGQEVTTTHGKITGFQTSVLGQPLDVYYGIPYAKPPVGDLRFQHPQPIDPWGPEVKQTIALKPTCQQRIVNSLGSPLRQTPKLVSEDCLYINVWAPSNIEANSSILVWIYGGAFSSGSINMPLHDGKYLAASSNLIVMSINYRLGAHGFIYLGPGMFPGNQGLMDQNLGLKWIYENARRFGGDPEKITIFGESAGGASVGHQMLSPLSKDYFKRAILQSGTPNSYWATHTPDIAKSNARTLAKHLDCPVSSDADVYECIMQQPPGSILEKQDLVVNTGGLPFAPVIDGYFIPENPKDILDSTKYTNKDILLGVMKDEATLFLMLGFPTIYQPKDHINVSRLQFTSSLNFFSVVLGSDARLVKAMLAQYESSQVPSLRDSYLDIADNLVSDINFKCPTAYFADSFAFSNNVYMYSFEHRLSTLNTPQWFGVAHSYELDIVFGHPLEPGDNSTEEEKEFTRTVIEYWTNFAKTGNPNTPSSRGSEWPLYDKFEQKYIVLDLNTPKVVRQGLRKQQCVFWNTLVPMLAPPQEPVSPTETTTEKVIYRCNTSQASSPIASVTTLITVISSIFYFIF